MKLVTALMLLVLSQATYAYVDSKECPESFSITYSDVTRADLNTDIESTPMVKISWDRFKSPRTLSYKFNILSRTSTALCVYGSADGSSASLQTNDGVDEVVVNFDFRANLPLYFKTKVASFSPKHLEIVDDEEGREVHCPVYEYPETLEVRSVILGSAKSVSTK